MRVEDETTARVAVAVNEVVDELKLQFMLSKIGGSGDFDVEDRKVFRANRLIPPNSSFMVFWDLNTILWLAFTAIVTPFEVAFVDTTLMHPLFWLNRLVDLFFICDMVLQFFLPYRDPETNTWVTSHRAIAKKYLTSWFIIDVISIIPFDIIGVVQEDPSVQKLKALRLIRLLRLLKLLRLLRTSRITSRWAPLVPIRYAVMSLVRFGCAMLISAHWIACLIGILPLLEGTTWSDLLPEDINNGVKPLNWQVAYFETNLGYARDSYNIWTVYLGGYYLAAMTLTTIGYGDVVAKTDVERGVMLLVMLVGGGFYAFAIGNVFNIVSSMDPLTSEFRSTMDDLNSVMDDVGLPSRMKKKVRKYFHFSLYHKRAMNNAELLTYLTPSLKRVTAYVVNKAWVDQLPFLSRNLIGDDRDLVVLLGNLFKHRACGSLERIYGVGDHVVCIYVIERGAVLLHTTKSVLKSEEGVGVGQEKRSKHMYVQDTVDSMIKQELTTGTCFGQEAIYGVQHDIKASYNVTTLTHVELHYIEKADFMAIVRKFPHVYERLKLYAVRREWTKNKVVASSSDVAQTTLPDLTSLEIEVQVMREKAAQLRQQVAEKSNAVQKLVE